MKTKTDSYLINQLPKGCALCLKGQKLVLFIGGKCSRACSYCSLSDGRKNTDQIWANERPCNSTSDIIKEAYESNAKGAGITGGDPLAYLKKTIQAAKALKLRFGKKFHIHIYLPLPLASKEKLQKLKPYIDEIRFHPSFLTTEDKKLETEELEKIKTASQIFGQQNIGLELPLIPNSHKQIIQFTKKTLPHISFLNLNELELSDTNLKTITSKHKINQDTYTISNSLETGKKILNSLKNSNLSIHLCTAKTKNLHQYHNRLLKHEILPFGTKTQDATVIYVEIPNSNKETVKELKKYTKKFYIDKPRNRILVDQEAARKLLQTKKFDLYFSEEHPTFEAEKMSYWKLTEEDFE